MNNIQKLIRSGESERIEFKQSFDKESIETVVSLATTQRKTIFIGIKVDDSLCGVEIGLESFQSYSNSIKSSTEPSLIVDIQLIPVDDKKLLSFRLMNFLSSSLVIKANTLKESTIVIIKWT